MCFSPRHDLTLPEMALPDIRQVVDVWAGQTIELGQQYRWVQIFENKGRDDGLLEPPSSWANLGLPDPAHGGVKEDDHQRAYRAERWLCPTG